MKISVLNIRKKKFNTICKQQQKGKKAQQNKPTFCFSNINNSCEQLWMCVSFENVSWVRLWLSMKLIKKV